MDVSVRTVSSQQKGSGLIPPGSKSFFVWSFHILLVSAHVFSRNLGETDSVNDCSSSCWPCEELLPVGYL